jgi:heat shock protein HtpX
MNLLEQQAANRRRTWIVMAIFVGFLAIVGAGVDTFLLGNGETFVPFATLAAVAIGGGQSWWSLRFGDRSVLASAAAVPLAEKLAGTVSDAERLRYRQLQNIVEEMSIAAGIPVPQTFVIPDNDPNAFATGRDPAHASIAVTEGLLQKLSREELQGVVAHEMGHVRNLDIRLMTVVAALVGALALLADWTARGMRFGGGRRSSKREKGGGNALFFAVWLVAVLLAPVVGRLLALAVSRRREYLADATGAELTRNPLGLAGALEKIESAVDPTPSIKQGTAHLCIADPLGRPLSAREGAWAELWATHPPMSKRIAALREMGYVRGGKSALPT